MFSVIFLILISLLAFLLLIAVSLAVAIGIGWVLMQFLPFTLFEGSVLGLIALIMVTPIAARFLRFIMKPQIDEDALADAFLEDLLEDAWEEDWDEELEEEMLIPPKRFFKGKPTWEDWLEYSLANEIYQAFVDDPARLKPMNERQQQELAIRLGEVAVQVLKKKPPSTRKLRITRKQLEQALQQQGQKPYDADIMELAAHALADALIIYEEELLYIIRNKAWRHLSKL